MVADAMVIWDGCRARGHDCFYSRLH